MTQTVSQLRRVDPGEARLARGRGSRGADFDRGRGSRIAGQRPAAAHYHMPTLRLPPSPRVRCPSMSLSLARPAPPRAWSCPPGSAGVRGARALALPQPSTRLGFIPRPGSRIAVVRPGLCRNPPIPLGDHGPPAAAGSPSGQSALPRSGVRADGKSRKPGPHGKGELDAWCSGARSARFPCLAMTDVSRGPFRSSETHPARPGTAMTARVEPRQTLEASAPSRMRE